MNRPIWCPHPDCEFIRQTQDLIYSGKLFKPELHDTTPNTHRLCVNTQETNHGVFDLQVNDSDVDTFRWILDGLDGKKTSWRSSR